MKKRIYTERRVYYYTCRKCGRENAQTFKRRKITIGLCGVCKRNQPVKGQVELFTNLSI